MSKKTKTVIEPIGVTRYILRVLVSAYVLIMFVAMPLIYHDKYFDIGDFKFDMYAKITIVMLVAVGIVWVVHLIYFVKKQESMNALVQYLKEAVRKFTVLDWFVIGYAAIATLSYLLSDFKEASLSGYDGWKMGLLSQLSFVLLYFLISRFWCENWKQDLIWILCTASAITFLLAILHRFMIDPLALYEGIDSGYYIQFLTTIGQATWYSSFLCTVLPVGVVLFWYCDKRWQRVCLGIYCFLGFSSLVTQNSDSAFLALGAICFTLFCLSFDSEKKFKRFLETMILALASMRVMGILQIVFADRAVQLDTLSIFFSQNAILWAVLVVLFVAYAGIIYSEKKDKFQISDWKWLRTLAIILLIGGFFAMFNLIIQTTNGELPSMMAGLYDSQYFNFNETWGNNRGFTWQYSAKMFAEYPFKEKIIGIGPDAYASYTYLHYAEEVSAKWGDSVLTNAHNEWFNMMINEGILGLISYGGIFISAACIFIKNRKKDMMLPAVAICIFSYLFHNMFCYQQVMCTPIIFILLGIGACYLRMSGEYKKS